MGNVRVCVLSDDRLFCKSVVRLLAGDPGITPRALDDPAHAAVVSGDYDIAILDARMNGILNRCSLFATGGLSVILIGAPDDDAWAIAGLVAGARGIVTKASGGEDLAKAVRIVHAGCVWARRRWLNAALKYLAVSTNQPASASQLGARLSGREQEVFRQAARGLGNKELAYRLSISEATVKIHLTHIYQKLGVSGRAELAAVYYGLHLHDAASHDTLKSA